MAADPETISQIDALSRDARPLLVVDVDEVVLEFVSPFAAWLRSQGLTLGTEKFALHGNIFREDRQAIPDEDVTGLIAGFWGVQARWQGLAAGVAAALEKLAPAAEIVLLTAMPHAHRETRRAHLQRLGLPYPLLTTEMAKGPCVRRLRGEEARLVAFVDDIARNHLSVRADVPDAALFLFMAHEGMRRLLPPPPPGITTLESWDAALPLIAAALGVNAK